MAIEIGADRSERTRDVVLVKLGGSLITDKHRPGTARPEVISRLAGELAAASREMDAALVIGHGSGSFGHAAAARHQLQEGLTRPEQLQGIAETQADAAALDRRVVTALREVGLPTFVCAPSSAMVGKGGVPVSAHVEPVALALRNGLLPVVFGDVVMDRERGVAIFSTETVLLRLATDLGGFGWRVKRALWVGETAGVYDADGRTIDEITPANAEAVLGSVGGAEATDVTGGMAHRVRSALAMARAGIPSWIGDGTVDGRLHAALLGGDVPGTRVHGARARPSP